MIKIPFEYKINQDYSETLEAIELIKKTIKEFIYDKLSVVELKQPLFFNYKKYESEIFGNKRVISFDTNGYEEIFYTADNFNNFLIENMERISKKKEGILLWTSYIKRDAKITNISSLQKEHLYLSIKINNPKLNIIPEEEHLISMMFKMINKLISVLTNLYKGIKHKNIEGINLLNYENKAKEFYTYKNQKTYEGNETKTKYIDMFQKQTKKYDYHFNEYIGGLYMPSISKNVIFYEQEVYKDINDKYYIILKMDISILEMFLLNKATILECQSNDLPLPIEKILKGSKLSNNK